MEYFVVFVAAISAIAMSDALADKRILEQKIRNSNNLEELKKEVFQQRRS